MFKCIDLGEERAFGCGAVVDLNVKIPTLSRKKRGTRVALPHSNCPAS